MAWLRGGALPTVTHAWAPVAEAQPLAWSKESALAGVPGAGVVGGDLVLEEFARLEEVEELSVVAPRRWPRLRRSTCQGRSSAGLSRPAAPTRSSAASTVSAWKRVTRGALSRTERPTLRDGFWVATPVGQALVLHAACLDAADGHHHRTGRITNVRAEGHQSHETEAARDLSARDQGDAIAQADAADGVVGEDQAFGERGTQGIGELDRGSAGSTLAAVDGDEVGMEAGLDHGLADREELAPASRCRA